MSQHILFVDDELAILKALERIFRKEGYTVHTANSGKGALELLENTPVDVIISDMRMPHMDGATFLEKAKQAHPNSVRIVLTGFADMDATISAINNGGIYGYLTKPWDSDQIKGLVSSAMALAFKNKQQKQAVTSLIRDHNNLKDKVERQEKEMAMADRYVEDAYSSLKSGYSHMEDVLVNLICLKDPTQREMIDWVTTIVEQVGTQLCLNDKELDLLKTAAKLHSVGKIALQDHLLFSPLETLSEDDKTRYYQYAEHSACTLMPFEPYQEVAQLLMLQKSYIDGTGTVRDEEHTEASLYARILTIAIDYVDYRTGHVTGSALTHDDAIIALESHATRYDERMIALISTTTMTITDTEEQFDILVPVKSLRKNMILNKDLVSKKGTLLLKKGTVFTNSLIHQIQRVQKNNQTPIMVSVRFNKRSDAPVQSMMR